MNLYLNAISANILQIQRDLELDKKEVSAQIILNRYLGKEHAAIIYEMDIPLETYIAALRAAALSQYLEEE